MVSDLFFLPVYGVRSHLLFDNVAERRKKFDRG